MCGGGSVSAAERPAKARPAEERRKRRRVIGKEKELSATFIELVSRS
jgi:hypothetical protein